jgi:Na+-translocating ferredoxin:NAD+ oxidoreductase subunit B
MNSVILYTILTLVVIGALSAIILYFVARKFKIVEDPRIDDVEKRLPGVNCGGCGHAGCRAFAEACIKENDLSNLFCPVGGNDVMAGVAGILGLQATHKDPRVAVVRCNGTCENRPKTNRYEGAETCAIIASLYSGETGCRFGCLSFSDCCLVCKFDAIHMNRVTGLPEIIDEKCTACGACVNACPRKLIELRRKFAKERKIYVACMNEENGGVARKSCEVACIGCGKCQKECAFDAITIVRNLAFIDSGKCKLCRKCKPVCPTNSIIEVGFPPRITRKETAETINVNQ